MSIKLRTEARRNAHWILSNPINEHIDAWVEIAFNPERQNSLYWISLSLRNGKENVVKDETLSENGASLIFENEAPYILDALLEKLQRMLRKASYFQTQV